MKSQGKGKAPGVIMGLKNLSGIKTLLDSVLKGDGV